jgi:hypothetical protein
MVGNGIVQIEGEKRELLYCTNSKECIKSKKHSKSTNAASLRSTASPKSGTILKYNNINKKFISETEN